MLRAALHIAFQLQEFGYEILYAPKGLLPDIRLACVHVASGRKSASRNRNRFWLAEGDRALPPQQACLLAVEKRDQACDVRSY